MFSKQKNAWLAVITACFALASLTECSSKDDELDQFMPGGSAGAAAGPRPDQRRNREFLEQFSLDTLRMVGTLRLQDRTYGLIKTKDGLVHRVSVGAFVGQADGHITEITPSKISIVELVPDGVGGYMERPAALALNN